MNKNDEVLAVYMRIRGNDMVPTLPMYNKILKSIQLRSASETSEERLTHLLNVYSDMLSNNLKPDEVTYELVIEPLLKGSLKSHKVGKFNEGFDFFKIAMELFLISHGPTHATPMKFNNDSIYLNIIRCLNDYQLTSAIQPQELYNMLKDKIAQTHHLEFYIQLMRFAKYHKDMEFVTKLYNEMNNSMNPTILELNQFKIYSYLVEAFNYCGESQKSTFVIDRIINGIEDKTSEEVRLDLSKLLSSYIQSLSPVNPQEAYNTLLKFESIPWLPDVNVAFTP
ncbi:unnamed protein product [Ambrosiozyma monospora]|uniref:Unnamed protein product n=1 Tax=Ambrosiozyma monospora TaxID=43982 RepID=A0ACB5U9C2_AMBMO|nr:unnamed protein product [Ambrosiozyma monospora]